MAVPVAWINGVLTPFTQAALPLWDLGVVAGASVTEMARTFGHQPFRLDEHLQRLTRSCAALGFPMAYTPKQIEDVAREIIEHNSRLIAADGDLGVVALITAGSNATYLGGRPSAAGTTAVHTFPLPFSMWRQSLTEGVRLRIPSVRQPPDESIPVSIKSRNRLHWWMADREAATIEPGSKALMLTISGLITETSTSCFYGVRNNVIITPGKSVLDSMSRRVVEQLADQIGIRFERCDIDPIALADLDEAFLSSSPSGLLPICRIEGRPIGPKTPGPVFTQLAQSWNCLAGIDIQKQILTAD